MRIKFFLAIVAVLMTAGLSVLVVGGSSHNDAPLIHQDPLANNTDVYAFVSPDNPDSVTLIANYIPMAEPGDGPTYTNFDDNVLYEIMVDVDGDLQEDITYQFKFKTLIGAITGNTFLYNAGPITVPGSDPTQQYGNLNIHQSYTLTQVLGDRRTGSSSTLLQGARVAPANIGPQSTPNYDSLANAAIHDISTSGGLGRVFVGPRDEGFYLDLMAAFDLLGGFTDPQREPVDTFSGFNVYTLALEIPKQHFEDVGDTDGIIGVWASASRRRVSILPTQGGASTDLGSFVQVSRLGNPLINELLNPLAVKDRFNASEPKDDVSNGIDGFIVDPGPTQGGAALIPLLASILPSGCAPDSGRIDLALALLNGIPGGSGSIADALDNAIPSLAPFTAAGGNQDTQNPGGPIKGDVLRLNYNVSPSTSPSSFGFFGGDPAGFPNGRRVGEDTGDIYLRAGAGAILHVLGVIDCDTSLSLSDGAQENDAEYLDAFPYLAAPHQAYDHNHTHGSGLGPLSMLGIGSGLLGAGIALGAVYTLRRRRNFLKD